MLAWVYALYQRIASCLQRKGGVPGAPTAEPGEVDVPPASHSQLDGLGSPSSAHVWAGLPSITEARDNDSTCAVLATPHQATPSSQPACGASVPFLTPLPAPAFGPPTAQQAAHQDTPTGQHGQLQSSSARESIGEGEDGVVSISRVRSDASPNSDQLVTPEPLPDAKPLGRYMLDSGKVVGVANTVARYHEAKPLVPHLTPFNDRVEREVAAERHALELAGRPAC